MLFWITLRGNLCNKAVETIYNKHKLEVYLHTDANAGTAYGYWANMLAFATNDYVERVVLGESVDYTKSPYKEFFRDNPKYHLVESEREGGTHLAIDYFGKGSTRAVSVEQELKWSNYGYQKVDEHTLLLYVETSKINWDGGEIDWEEDEYTTKPVPWTIIRTMNPIEKVKVSNFCIAGQAGFSVDEGGYGVAAEIVTKDSQGKESYFYSEFHNDPYKRTSMRKYGRQLKLVEEEDEAGYDRYCIDKYHVAQ